MEISAKNQANQTISRLNKQVVAERAKMFREQQESKAVLQEEFRLKEARLEQSLHLLERSVKAVEEREAGWQEERAALLGARDRAVKLLAAEYEEENLTREQRRSLTAEVVRLVVSNSNKTSHCDCANCTSWQTLPFKQNSHQLYIKGSINNKASNWQIVALF